uniref:Uncharacterized protein n=1 Tax=Rhizophagus irregularis (strain DAOM 181602 / DAOM 197198 / MUCL 43194) TaxID=747089 RepID=U9TM10_RHIID
MNISKSYANIQKQRIRLTELTDIHKSATMYRHNSTRNTGNRRVHKCTEISSDHHIISEITCARIRVTIRNNYFKINPIFKRTKYNIIAAQLIKEITSNHFRIFTLSNILTNSKESKFSKIIDSR